MLKKLIFTALLCAPFLQITAQNGKDWYDAPDRAIHSDDTVIVRDKNRGGWIRAHLFDDWFIQMQGGGQLYYGTDDRKGPLGDRLTANGEIQIGRRIFPMMGVRLGLGYGYAHGFITKEHYNAYNSAIVSHGFSGQCGTDDSGNLLGGYYWKYDDKLYQQKWKYYYFGADIFMNLDYFRGSTEYDPDKKINHIIYGGVHTKFAQSEVDTTNHRSEAHIGYICKYNFNKYWGIYADIRGSFIERLFDREWIPGLESAGAGVDFVMNLHVGINYKFHVRRTRDRFKMVENSNVSVDTSFTKSYYYVKMEQTQIMQFFDTLHTRNEYRNMPTPDMVELLNSMQDEIDKMKDKIYNIHFNPLDSVLINQMLPFEMVYFELDKWDILPEEEMKIEKMARIMQAFPDEKFILTGSADIKTGTVKRNDFLSHNRADVVYNILTNEYGVNPDQLTREYLGGIDDYKPFYLNRCTVIIMDHPTVMNAFKELKSKGISGGEDVKIEN